MANAYREKWAKAQVRRSLQAHRPYEPDVVIEGDDVPGLARALWTEAFCSNGANEATVAEKLLQAERDAAKAQKVKPTQFYRLPVVVWRRSGTRAPNVTIRLGSLLFIIGEECTPERAHLSLTLSLKEFLWAMP